MKTLKDLKTVTNTTTGSVFHVVGALPCLKVSLRTMHEYDLWNPPVHMGARIRISVDPEDSLGEIEDPMHLWMKAQFPDVTFHGLGATHGSTVIKSEFIVPKHPEVKQQAYDEIMASINPAFPEEVYATLHEKVFKGEDGMLLDKEEFLGVFNEMIGETVKKLSHRIVTTYLIKIGKYSPAGEENEDD